MLPWRCPGDQPSALHCSAPYVSRARARFAGDDAAEHEGAATTALQCVDLHLASLRQVEADALSRPEATCTRTGPMPPHLRLPYGFRDEDLPTLLAFLDRTLR